MSTEEKTEQKDDDCFFFSLNTERKNPKCDLICKTWALWLIITGEDSRRKGRKCELIGGGAISISAHCR